MKIALGQFKVIPNRPDLNTGKMLEMIERAKKEKVDIIAFPEMSIGGYLLGDKWVIDDFCKDLMHYNRKIKDASKCIAVIFGNVFLDDKINERVNDDKWHPNKDGRTRKYNAAYVFQDGKSAERLRRKDIIPEGVQPKTLLPNYRFFDDERYFFSLEDIAKDFDEEIEDLTQPFLIGINGKKVPVGIELCEDLWCNDYRKKGESLNPTKMLIDNGAELIINISSSSWTYGKNNARDRRVIYLKKELKDDFVPFYYVNCTGAQNNGKNIITFDGGSTYYGKDANPVILSENPYTEELLLINSNDKKITERKEKPMIAQKYRAIKEGIEHIKDIFGKDEHPKFLIGLSGGIDSAVTCALLVNTVGKDKVIAVNMPSRYNSQKTKDAAEFIAEKLEVEYNVVPIEDMVSINETLVNEGKGLSTLNKENIQAKIRGTSILSNFAAKHGSIFTNNGNKLEIALGYATLYGDVNGAIAPIGDLTKAEVFEMAEFLNEEIFGKEVIPKKLIPDDLFRFGKDQIQPSAELKDDQIDPMKFGYHCALLEKMTNYIRISPEDILRWYKKGKLAKNLGIEKKLIERWGIDNPKEFTDDLDWFIRQVENNVFKRVQSPPIIITSKSAYGYDIRESQLPFRKSNEYEKLKKEILSMEKYEEKKDR